MLAEYATLRTLFSSFPGLTTEEGGNKASLKLVRLFSLFASSVVDSLLPQLYPSSCVLSALPTLPSPAAALGLKICIVILNLISHSIAAETCVCLKSVLCEARLRGQLLCSSCCRWHLMG